uniref:Uncharacterized protein n=2 Tax=Physcomitrium patens TaxID=3218 RepID=A0A2K1IVZ4_PHYPA|nr:hypothetical protein PHYPA_025391 [Physcomitrium patens]
MNLEKDQQQSEIISLRTQLNELQTSQRQLLEEVAKLKKNVTSQEEEMRLQDMSKLKQKMEAQKKMFELTINVYLKEKTQCINELTKDELKIQKKLHKLISQKTKGQKCNSSSGTGIEDRNNPITADVVKAFLNRAESRRDHADTTKSNQQQPPSSSSSSSSATAGVVIVVPPPQSTATTWDCPSIERIAASDAGAGAAVLMNGDNAAAVLKEDPDPETASTPRRSPPKLQNQVFFCRSCSPPHDRTQLPACLQSASNSTSSKPAPASTLSEASGSGLADNEEESLRRPPSSTPSTPRLRCFQTPRSQLGLGCATGGGGPRPRPSTSDCFIRLDSSPMRTRVPSFAKRDDGSCAQSGPVTPPDSRLADSARDCFSRALEPGASKKSHAVITASQPSRHRSSSKQRLNSCLSVNPSSSLLYSLCFTSEEFKFKLSNAGAPISSSAHQNIE